MTGGTRKSWLRKTQESISNNERPPFCDVAFICSGEPAGNVYAIKGMLAMHSHVFQTMFFTREGRSGFRENNILGDGESLVVRVPWGQLAMSRMIGFILTGEICTNREDILEQIILADHYAVTPLLNALVEMVVEEGQTPGFHTFGKFISDQQQMNHSNKQGSYYKDKGTDDSCDGSDSGKEGHFIASEESNTTLECINAKTPLVDRENVLGALECSCATSNERLRAHCLRIILAPDFGPAVLAGEDASGGAALAALSEDALCCIVGSDALALDVKSLLCCNLILSFLSTIT